MRHIYLMTFFETQPCIKGEKPYISIQKVKNQRNRRLTKTKGNANFTDLWFQMVDSTEKLEGKYIGQYFSLLTDKESFQPEIWHQDGQSAFVLLIKVKVDVLDAEDLHKEEHGHSQTTINIIAETLNEYISLNMQDVFCETFYTLDNADIILIGHTKTFAEAESVVEKIVEEYKEKWFYSYYSIIGKVDVIEKLSVDQNSDETEKLIEYRLTDIEFGVRYLARDRIENDTRCEIMMTDLKIKIQQCSCEKNKKWLSYYQTLYQIVSYLMQNERKSRFKDLFYILFPSLRLFYEQLNSGLDLLKLMSSDSYTNLEEQKRRHYLEHDIENSVSDYIDNMELLIHHIGISCTNVLNAARHNGLPYDVPMRLCMLYLAALNEAATILKDTSYQYQFLLAPLAYSRPKTRLFVFGLEPENRLIQVRIARHQIYSPRVLLAILVHEANHYIGQNSRLRTVRSEKYIEIAVEIVLEKLLPNEQLREIISNVKLDKTSQRILWDDWKKRKSKLRKHYCVLIQREIIKQNQSRKHKYHFKELHQDIDYFIKINILNDPQKYLIQKMNELDDRLQTQIRLSQPVVQSSLLEVIGREQDILKECILEAALSDSLYNELETVRDVMKEVYADYGSILILDLEPLEYMESYLLSEGHQPSDDTINSMLINRVAMVHTMVSENADWKDKWEKATLEDWESPYLWKVKQAVDDYLKMLKHKPGQVMDMEVTNDILKEGYKTNRCTSLLFRECIQCEKDYLEQAYYSLKQTINRNEVADHVKRLRTVYKHFKVYEKGQEPSYHEFFLDLDDMIADYKNSVKQYWDVP